MFYFQCSDHYSIYDRMISFDSEAIISILFSLGMLKVLAILLDLKRIGGIVCFCLGFLQFLTKREIHAKVLTQKSQCWDLRKAKTSSSNLVILIKINR